LDFIIRSLKVDLGFDVFDESIKIDQIKSLGRVSPDAGMTNNRPNLYAITIMMDKIAEGDKKEDNVGAVIWPIEKISDLISKCDDAYFLAALSRLNLLDKND
jgi:hypothetical protein